MSRVLIVAEHANGRLSLATAKTLSCARQLGAAEIAVVVFAVDAAAVAVRAVGADDAGDLHDVRQVLVLVPAHEFVYY